MDNPVDKYMRDCIDLWKNTQSPPFTDQLIILGKVQGDLCKIIRDHREGTLINLDDYYKGLANLALSSLRFISYSNLLTLEEILESAYQSQKDHIEKLLK